MFRFFAKSSLDRLAAVEVTRGLLDQAGASLWGIRYYASHSVVFELCVDRSDWRAFREALGGWRGDVQLLDFPGEELPSHMLSQDEITGTLQLTLLGEVFDQRDVVPMVPG